MLMEYFEAWKKNHFNMVASLPEREQFEAFFEDYDKSDLYYTMTEELGWQIYQLQVCMEGLLADQDLPNTGTE